MLAQRGHYLIIYVFWMDTYGRESRTNAWESQEELVRPVDRVVPVPT